MEIKPTPEQPPAFDPQDPRFWDPDDLEHELRRVFEICHGCRMCVGYCPSFPFLFDRIDENHEKHGRPHSAVSLDEQDLRRVTDLCFQCKICYVKCPYTPDDPQSTWLVDFPRLLWREKVVRARREGIPLQERVLGEPGLLGTLGAGVVAPLANLVSANRLVRGAMERTAGISQSFPLPRFARQPFPHWFRKHRPAAGVGEAGEVALFSTCIVDYHRPDTGRWAVAVLEHAGLRVVRPPQRCCGMPAMDTGDLDSVREKARDNVAALVQVVRRGLPVVAPGPSCSMMIKREWPDLLGTPDARLVAAHTFDLMEFLWKLWREQRLPRDFAGPLGTVAYHAPCHLRAQRLALPAPLLLEQVPDTQVTVIEQCSAVDGTWGMKAEYYELGRRYARKLTRAVADAEAKLVASDCPLASQRIEQENSVRVVHPVELLARAYGLAPQG